MKKIVVLAIILSVCLVGCALSGLNIQLDNTPVNEARLSE
jgi:hypothetical protein